MAETSCMLIDSATSLLMIYLPIYYACHSGSMQLHRSAITTLAHHLCPLGRIQQLFPSTCSDLTCTCMQLTLQVYCYNKKAVLLL